MNFQENLWGTIYKRLYGPFVLIHTQTVVQLYSNSVHPFKMSCVTHVFMQMTAKILWRLTKQSTRKFAPNQHQNIGWCNTPSWMYLWDHETESQAETQAVNPSFPGQILHPQAGLRSHHAAAYTLVFIRIRWWSRSKRSDGERAAADDYGEAW